MGDVTIRYVDYRYIGYIEANTIGMNESNVICRQLGYETAAAFTINLFHQGDLKYAMILKELKCNGTEYNLKNCTYWIDHDVDEVLEVHNVTGVICNTENTGKSCL